MNRYALILFCATWNVTAAWPQSANENAKIVHDWADQVATELVMMQQEGGEPFELVGRSLLRWSNPIAGEVFGDCYVWTHRGEPAAFMSVYAFFTPEDKRRVTLQSLSRENLIARRNGVTVWQPQSPGFDWLKVSNLPEPGSRRLVRQRQFRQIAAEFKAKIAESDDESGAFRELRLLTKPLHIYKTDGGRDGALFGFVDGTDPELLLRVETDRDEGGQIRVAAIRQNHRELFLERDGQTVWEAEALAPPFPNPRISDPAGVYFNTPWQKIVDLSGEATK